MKIKNNLMGRVLITTTILMLFMFSVFLGLAIGSSTSNILDSLVKTLNVIFDSNSADPLLASIIWKIRFPRVLISALAGAVLSLGGLVLQVLLKNPLAEPYLLGVSGGAAIGSILGILAGFSRFPGITAMAFSGSILIVLLLIWLASDHLVFDKNSLLLTGIMVNSFCSAIIMLLISVAKNSKLNNIMFWLMGDFSMASLDGIGILIFIIFICFLVLFRYSNYMNLLQLGRHMAMSMGVNVDRINIILLFFSSLMVSVIVSFCGLIGFVGLVIPHILRMVISNDHRILVPACIFCGSIYVILCDVIARVILSSGGLPTGVVTALIGSPIFTYILLVRYNS